MGESTSTVGFYNVDVRMLLTESYNNLISKKYSQYDVGKWQKEVKPL